MKKQIILTLGFALASSLATAQSFTVTLFPGSLIAEDGTTLDHSVQDAQGINIFFAETTTSAADLKRDPAK